MTEKQEIVPPSISFPEELLKLGQSMDPSCYMWIANASQSPPLRVGSISFCSESIGFVAGYVSHTDSVTVLIRCHKLPPTLQPGTDGLADFLVAADAVQTDCEARKRIPSPDQAIIAGPERALAFCKVLFEWIKQKKAEMVKGPGLTDLEKDCINHLTAAWNTFLKLPDGHPDSQDEFRHSLHECQRLIAARVAKRVDPNIWA